MHKEISDRIAYNNRCYYSIMKLLKSKLLSHNSKILLVKILLSHNSKILLYHGYLWPIVTTSKTWLLTKEDSKRLILKSKILRNIYGLRHNTVTNLLWKKKSRITRIIKQVQYYIAHVWKLYGQVIKEVLVNKINSWRPLGNSKVRWVDVIGQNVENIKKSWEMEIL